MPAMIAAAAGERVPLCHSKQVSERPCVTCTDVLALLVPVAFGALLVYGWQICSAD